MLTKGARPIRSQSVLDWYHAHVYQSPILEEYTSCWEDWLTRSSDKTIHGLDHFRYRDYTQGTSQSFDHFALRYGRTHTLVAFTGDFQYHACMGRHLGFQYLQDIHDLTKNHALLVSVPFSDLGRVLPEFHDILTRCNELEVPVLLDLAYWGIGRNIGIDLDQYPCVVEITSSLSKCFFALEHHRVGVRFSRQYLDDGVSMQNEVGVQNLTSMSLGLHFMQAFSCDWNWETHALNYQQVCRQLGLETTDVVIFGTSQDASYSDFNRGRPGHYRLCLSKFLSDDL